MDLLKTENEALRKQVLALESSVQVPERNGILLPHFAFALMIISIIGLIAFLGYSQFRSEPQAQQAVQPIDSIPPAVDTTAQERRRMANQRKLAEAAAAKRAVDSAINAEIKKARDKAADSTEDLNPDTSVSPVQF
jgi:serine/threonine-protein kinase